jgi:Uma2 family endonuclease
MAGAAAQRATYANLDALPEGTKAHLIDGVLFVPPRPSIAHQTAETALGSELEPPFRRGRGGPGGWIILVEPEIRIAGQAVAPDLAGWRRERMPEAPRAAYATVAPDWICEVLSPSTVAHDRGRKLDLYAAWSVSHAWLIDPDAFTLEAYRLESGRWVRLGVWSDTDRVHLEPFDAIELDLSVLWTR